MIAHLMLMLVCKKKYSLLYHPGTLLAHCPCSLQIYQEEFGQVRGHFGPINTVAFTPDGKRWVQGWSYLGGLNLMVALAGCIDLGDSTSAYEQSLPAWPAYIANASSLRRIPKAEHREQGSRSPV